MLISMAMERHDKRKDEVALEFFASLHVNLGICGEPHVGNADCISLSPPGLHTGYGV